MTLRASALDAMSSRFSGEVITPGHASYDEARRIWNGQLDRRPQLIAQCGTVADAPRSGSPASTKSTSRCPVGATQSLAMPSATGW
jgi:hypothetical protein